MSERLEENSCSVCPEKGFCRKDNLIDEQDKKIFRLETEKSLILRKYEDIIKNLPKYLVFFDNKIIDEIEILKPIYNDLVFRFREIDVVSSLYVNRIEKEYDLIIVTDNRDFKTKYMISEIITQLMQQYKNYYFDFVILSRKEIDNLDIEIDEYINLEVGI